MKKLIKDFVSFLLKEFAKRKIKKTGAKVIAITGTVGKTSLKEAIAFILENDFKIKKTSKNLNGFFGLPLDILNQSFSSVPTHKWPIILIRCLLDLINSKEKYDYYVLEFGVAEPKEMQYLLSIVKPYISTITNIYPAHIENFPGGFEEYKSQKILLATKTLADGFVVLPERLIKSEININREATNLIKYGENLDNEYKILTPEATLNGIDFVIATKENKKFRIKNQSILGYEYIDSFAATAVIANLVGVNTETISERLAKFKLPAGRLNLINGIKNTIIIDGSYNSSRYSTISGLKALKLFGQTKIACLGDMRELGEFTKTEHEKVAEEIIGVVDLLILVGPLTKQYLLPKALELGFDKDKIFHFLSSEKAGKFLIDFVKGGEAILVKGSQNTILMERLVYELMLEKEKCKELLCRQDEYWDKVRSVTP